MSSRRFPEGMLNLELRRLRYFLVLADELHFARAAQRLNMAQPPLSEQIKKLEGELGLSLFRRDSRNVALTDAGRVLAAGARAAMLEIERAVLTAQQAQRGHAGHLRLGSISSGGVTFLPKMLRRLRHALPDVHVEVRQFSSNRALEALAQRSIDLAIVRTPVVGDALVHQPVFRDRVVLAMAQDHRLAGQASIRLSQARDERFVLFPPNQGHAAYNVVQRTCLAAGFIPTAAEFVEDVYAMLGLVAAGVGVALVPEALSQLQVEGVRFLRLDDVDAVFELSLVWRADEDRRLVDVAVSCLADGESYLGVREAA